MSELTNFIISLTIVINLLLWFRVNKLRSDLKIAKNIIKTMKIGKKNR